MGQIELRIVADSPEELQTFLAGLADGSIEPTVDGVTASTPAKRRGRRPAAETKTAETLSAPPAPAAETKPAETPPPAPPAPAAETKPAETPPPAPPAPAAEAQPEQASASERVRKALVAVIEKFGTEGPVKAKTILKDVGGAENITGLAPEKYDAVIAAAEQAIATTTTQMLD